CRDQMGGGGRGRRIEEPDPVRFRGLLRPREGRRGDHGEREEGRERRACDAHTTAMASISIRYSGAASAPIWTIVDAGSWSPNTCLRASRYAGRFAMSVT